MPLNTPHWTFNCLSFFYSFSMVVLITMGVIPPPTTMWLAMAEWRCPYFCSLTLREVKTAEAAIQRFWLTWLKTFSKIWDIGVFLCLWWMKLAAQSFSRLRLIKSFLCLCVDEAKLSNLTLLRVERDINTDKDKVFGRFATMKERRMTFLKGTVKCTKFVKLLGLFSSMEDITQMD